MILPQVHPDFGSSGEAGSWLSEENVRIDSRIAHEILKQDDVLL